MPLDPHVLMQDMPVKKYGQGAAKLDNTALCRFKVAVLDLVTHGEGAFNVVGAHKTFSPVGNRCP